MPARSGSRYSRQSVRRCVLRSGQCSGSLSGALPIPFDELLPLSLPIFRSDFYRIAGVEARQKEAFQLLFGRALFIFPD